MKNLIAYPSPKVASLPFLFVLALIAILAFKGFADKPACAIALSKLNVFYIGLDNPVTIVVRGVPADKVVVTGQGLTIEKKEGDNYAVRASVPGEGSITVEGGTLEPTIFRYRVKRIPDPTPKLGNRYRSGSMNNGEFKASQGIAVALENFDFDAKCEVTSYEITYLGKRQDPVTTKNTGARFNGQTQDFIYKAKPGDAYFFDDIRAMCPGDVNPRNLGGLAFRIK